VAGAMQPHRPLKEKKSKAQGELKNYSEMKKNHDLHWISHFFKKMFQLVVQKMGLFFSVHPVL